MNRYCSHSLARALAAVCIGVGALGLLSPAANATLMMDTGLVGGSGDVENVLLTGGSVNDTQGTSVVGETNQTHLDVVFTGTEDLFFPAQGQARIEAVDGAFDYIEIALADPTLGFGKLQFNIDAIADGTAHFEALDQFGALFVFDFSLNGGGQNFFTLFSNDNQVAVQFKILADVQAQNIADLQQVRLGPASRTIDVPEPATLGLFVAGLIGLLGLRRRLPRSS